MKKHLIPYLSLIALLICAGWGETNLFNSDGVNTVTNLTKTTMHATIQDAVDNADAGDVLEVGDGTYNETVVIDKSLTLQSANGRANATIQGSDDGTLGTIFIPSGIDDVTIGGIGKGFTIVGFDNDNGAVEVGAVYLQGAHQNITIQDNEIMADGDGGLVSEYNTAIDNIIVDNNTFSGQTFAGAMPGGIGFSTQFNATNNVPRQLVVMGGGENVTNSQNITFTNNEITGVAGGISSDDGISEQGNTLVTIDVLGATVAGNNFAGTTARFGTSLRVRGSATTVENNTFSSADLGVNCGHIFFGNGSSLTGADADVDDIEGILLNNTFDLAAGFDFTITHNATGAILNAPADAEVLILPGTYVLDGQLVIDENRSVRGLGAAKTDAVLQTNQNTGTSGDARGWFVVNTGIELSMSNLTLDGTGFLVWQAVRHKGFGTFDNVYFTEIKYQASGSPYQGTAMAVFGNGNVDVSNSMFDEIGRIGVQYFGAGITGSTFSNNMYTGKGIGDHLDYAVEVGAGAIATITGSTISGNKGQASSDGSVSAGILATTFFGAGTEAMITENTLTDNTNGVVIGFNESDATTATINNNDIFSNTSFGVRSTAVQVDATNNWWGDASGPDGEGSGTGDAISENVTFCPWLDAPKDDMGVATVSLVNNTTQSTGHCTIQDAIDNATAGDVIELSPTTYEERVVIDKSLTLRGATIDSTLYVLDGANLVGTGRGIFINSNVTDVTIEYLIVQNFAGSNGNTHAGIYANGGNNNLTVQHVAIMDNVGGSGFYANGPVDNVTLDNVTSEGHTSSARGIVIWNGHKSNITITNCTVRNNNCCGIELQDGTASGVTMSNNLVENNGDSGMSAVGLTSGDGPNIISNNTISSNGRFGMEIKNPDGTGLDSGDGSIIIENNTVSFTASMSMNNRDHAGIAVFRRGVLNNNSGGYNDIPTGVVVRNNTVTGYMQENPGATTSEGFGIVIEGVDHTVTGNTLEDNDVGLQLQGGGHANPNYTPNDDGDGDQADGQSPNYFGRGNAPYICSVTESGNTFTSNVTDVRLVTEDGVFTMAADIEAVTSKQVVLSDGSISTTYCTIQDAVDAASHGNTIDVSAGTYDENVNIGTPLTLNGANAGATACDGSRADETIKTGYIRLDANDVTIDGFTFIDGAQVPAGEKAAIEIIGGKSNITVQNNIFERNNGMPNPSFDQFRGIINDFGGVTNLTVEYNSFSGWHTGIYFQNADESSARYNCIDNNMVGISADNPIDVTVENNEITNNQFEGVGVGDTGAAASMSINNNNITGNLAGVSNYSGNGFEVDATSNWWGDAAGPDENNTGMPGNGDLVNENPGEIDFCPWLNDEVGVGTLVPLPVVMTRDITLALDANGQVTIVPSQVNNGSTDGCGDELATLELDVTTFDCDDVGENTVTLTVTDVNGLMASETATVTIVDNAAPLLIEDCPEDITVDNDAGECTAIVNFDIPQAFDVAYVEGWEDPAYTPNDYAGWTEFNSLINRAASGTNGITSKTGSAHGVFNSDGIAQTGTFSRTGGYTTAFGEGFRMQIDVYMDLSDPAVAANTYGWDASSAASKQDGSHLRDFIFHTASNASGEILVAGSNNTNFARRNDLATLNHYTITSSDWYTFEWDFKDAGDGSLAVDLNLYDAAGNLLFTETRNNPADNIATTVGGNRYTWFTFLAVDELAVDNAILARKLDVSCDAVSGTAFPVGTTTVTCSAMDACGNPVSCSFDITVNDAEDPEITSCPSNITVDNDPGECGAIVNFAATAIDNCDNDVNITYSQDPGTLFPVGTTTVTVTATDDTGNDVTCTFDVTVNDTENPEITCPDDVTVEIGVNCSPVLADYTGSAIVSDNCDGTVVTQSPVAGTILSVGANTITLTATDAAGNTDECTFVVNAITAISINDVSTTEGNLGTKTLTFTVSLSCASNQTVMVGYATANNSATTADNDYVATNNILTFTPGQTSKIVQVTINGDTKQETDESFFVNLSGAVNASIADNQGVGLILNDDDSPMISIADAAITEGNTGTKTLTFVVSLSQVSSQLITVNYATVNSSATTADNDYVAKQGTLVFVAGDMSENVEITINGDFKIESNETFFVNLSTANNAIINDGQAIGTITNDDAPTTANAGADQFNVCGTTTLAANAVNAAASETGMWTIAVGTGGSFSNATSPTSQFTGSIGVSYTLTWTITRDGVTSSDNIFIMYSPDSDGDGVCDVEDLCQGIDDNSPACNLDCPDNRVVMAAAVASDVYLQADQTISTNGTVTIGAGKTVIFQAGQSITLKTGFTASAGSSFTARIDDCSFMDNSATGGEEDLLQNSTPDIVTTQQSIEKIQLAIEPNPLSDNTRLRFQLPKEQNVVLRLLNSVGQEIARPYDNAIFAAGEHIYLLDAQLLPSGIYYVQLVTNEERIIQKIIVAKQ